MINTMITLPQKIKFGIIFGFFLLSCYGSYHFIVSPQQAQLAKLQQQEPRLKRLISSALKKQATLKENTKDIKELITTINNINKKFKNYTLFEFIADVRRISQLHNTQIITIAPSLGQPTPPKNKGKSKTPTRSSKNMQISISTTGSYINLLKMTMDILNINHFLTITEYTFTPLEKDSKLIQLNMKLNVDFTSYRAKRVPSSIKKWLTPTKKRTITKKPPKKPGDKS